MSFADLLPFILIGFAAQLVDGALGMAFGTIATTLLMSIGTPPMAPATASATVHTVECFTSGASGISHVAHRNVDWNLFTRLVLPGMAGGILGAYVLTQVPAETARPLVLAYLAAIGLFLIWRGTGHPPAPRKPRIVAPLGLVGGFLDASGGGGWGAVVTSNLLIQGAEPRKVIGTVSAAEFFLTVTVSFTFLIALGWEAFGVATVGLLIGGMVAAPLGGYAAKRVPARGLMIMVGVVLVATSAWGIWRTLG
ncbi:MAG TPA: sulfite exporter TauE/SafE family protein [Allosphingosinicella sp.]